MDIKNVILWLDHHANPSVFGSQGKCATFIRESLEAGGFDTTGHPVDAKFYGPFLQQLGFSKLDFSNYTAHPGDISVLQPVNETTHCGHVAMYNGSQWVSDFKQRDIWAGPDFRNAHASIAVYRYS